MAKIHPTAVVEDGAVLGDGVEIGPLCFVGRNVKIGDGTRLIAQCSVDGYTTLGKNNVLHPFAALGQPAQDHSVVPGAATYLNVGDNNIFREGTAIHTGTLPESATTIGNNNMFMNGSHVAHNCKVGNNVHYISLAVTGGYAEVQDAETINVIKHIFRIYYRSGLIPSKALEQIRTELPQIPEVQEFLDFCANSKKGVVPPNHGGHRN